MKYYFIIFSIALFACEDAEEINPNNKLLWDIGLHSLDDSCEMVDTIPIQNANGQLEIFDCDTKQCVKIFLEWVPMSIQCVKF